MRADVFAFDGELALPVWDHCVAEARTGCSVGVLPDADGAWDRTVDVFRRHAPLRMEPWPGGVVNTIEKVHAMLDAVPGLGLLVDTGHVATWGEDPVELSTGPITCRSGKLRSTTRNGTPTTVVTSTSPRCYAASTKSATTGV